MTLGVEICFNRVHHFLRAVKWSVGENMLGSCWNMHAESEVVVETLLGWREVGDCEGEMFQNYIFHERKKVQFYISQTDYIPERLKVAVCEPCLGWLVPWWCHLFYAIISYRVPCWSDYLIYFCHNRIRYRQLQKCLWLNDKLDLKRLLFWWVSWVMEDISDHAYRTDELSVMIIIKCRICYLFWLRDDHVTPYRAGSSLQCLFLPTSCIPMSHDHHQSTPGWFHGGE